MKLETKHKEIIWCIILSLGLIIFFATGCKPKQVIQEKIIYKTDSLAITKLRDSLYRQEKKIAILEIDLLRTKEENSKLTNEVSRYETNYDTSKPIVPETGKPPVSSEITTISKSQLEKNLKESEKRNAGYRIENETLTRVNRNQELIIQSLQEENRDLKEKTTPTTGFNIKLFLIGVGTGILLIILLLIFIRR
ncbi:hypothetical protein DSECCO2_121460 [anaerobic digester metagenome]